MADETSEITQHNKIPEGLQVSEIRYRRLFESARDGILILDVASRKITDVNPYMMELLGYSRDEFLGKEIWEIGLFKNKEESQTAFRELQETGYIRYEDMPLQTKSGKQWNVEFISNVYREDSDHVIQCNIRDITERKRAEEALRQSEERYRIVTDTASEAIITIDENSTILFINPSTEKIFGYSAAEMIGESLTILMPEYLRHLHNAGMNRYLETERKHVSWEAVELPGLHKNGQEIPLEISFSEYINSGHRYFTGIARDITPRKQAEEHTRNTEERLRIILETSRDGILIENDSLIIYVNKSYLQLLGYNKDEELLGKPVSEILPPEEGERMMEYGHRRLRGESVPSIYEFKAKRKDGTLVDVEGAVSTSFVGGKKYIATTIRDLTERKQAQQALVITEIAKRRLAERQAAILNALPSEICLLDGDGNILDVNVKWREFAFKNNYEGSSWGIGSNYLATCESANEIAIEGAKQAADGIRAVISGKSKHFDMEYPCHSPTEQRWFKLMVVPIYEDPSEGVVVMHVNITESELAKNALRDVTLELDAAIFAYRQVLGKSLDVICTVDGAGRFVQVSAASKEVWGYEPAELTGKMYIELVHPDDRYKTILAATGIMSGIATSDFDNRYVRKDGSVADIMWSANWSEPDGVMFCVARDVSQIKKAEKALNESEKQLRQAQKLESVGRLAGGIAHDFNNMLTAINGYSDLTLRRLQDDDPLRRNIEEIKKAGERSASLTHQLLAFSRQQILQPVVLNLNEVITDTLKMLQRLIGEDVQLVTALNPKSGQVKVDPGQLSQIIMNLSVNARDAMPQGGRLTIETANVDLDEESTRHHADALPGAYVMLSMSDTGTGMNAETQQHLFEPFFTTKGVGKGTGLGLATVYGIVKQSGGNIWVHSEEGVGTTFKIYLPQVVEQAKKAELKDSSDELPRGTEMILLVEDEEMVRSLTRQILEESGYTVFEAQSGAEALSLCEKNDCHIDLLMTDVVMPHMGGRELAERFAHIYPNIQILFTSGYTDDAVVRHGVISAEANFIQKPFTPDGLAHKVREVLDAHGK